MVVVVEGERRLVRTLGYIGFHATSEIARFRIGHPCISLVIVVGHRALQLHATVKHFFRSPTKPRLIAVNGSQRRATGEHLRHVGDLVCIEVHHVKRSQRTTTFEHLIHCGYVSRVEVRHIKRSQARATGEHLMHCGYFSRVEVRHIKRSQTRATGEHSFHAEDVLRVEVLHIERSQTRATPEHFMHVGDVLGVEVRHVKRSQARAPPEHVAHEDDFLGVEVRHVQRSQTRATGEHPIHVSDVLGVEIFQPFDLLERIIIVEPPGSGGGTEISERGIKHHAHGGIVYHLPCSCPCRVSPGHIRNPPSSAGAGGTLVVVVEGKGRPIPTSIHIGFASLRLRTQWRSE